MRNIADGQEERDVLAAVPLRGADRDERGRLQEYLRHGLDAGLDCEGDREIEVRRKLGLVLDIGDDFETCGAGGRENARGTFPSLKKS